MTTGCFRDLRLKEEYRSDTDDLSRDFVIPALQVAASYDRAVGYFTSDGLNVVGPGLKAFIARGARARLVASPHLTAEDVEAIESGLLARQDVVRRRLLDALAEAEPPPDSLVLLAWMLANDRLEIRLAVPRSGRGIYHEKVGVFTDHDGCRVAFGGSANETVGGLVSNFEAIDVFFSWDTTAQRVARKVANFEGLWNGETQNLFVMGLPEAVERELVTIAERHAPRVFEIIDPPSPRLPAVRPPDGMVARDYQESAIEAWLSHGGRGILSMATGSGKTKTALGCVSRLLASEAGPPRPIVIVSVPYIHLVDQWADECRAWGLAPILCYESSRDWVPEAREALDTAGLLDRTVMLITTIRTATLSAFQALLNEIADRNVLLVGDEVHHLGANQAATILRPEIRWRLGLSATPSRWNDEAGSDLLESYFGGVIFEFTLKQAIDAGRLVPYHYRPVLVELDRDELRAYRSVMERIESESSASDDGRSQRLVKLMDERARILDTASGKPSEVRRQIEGRRLTHSLFYCASRLQMGAVSDVLRSEGHVPMPFTAEEDRRTRAVTLAEFEKGLIPAIVAMRALDEGVDVPDTREAHLLASSGNPREFIQRRGRILRLAPGKESASLIDYVVAPVVGGALERRIVEREMTRVLDFASTSLDPDAARDAVWPILSGFDLIHLVGR